MVIPLAESPGSGPGKTRRSTATDTLMIAATGTGLLRRSQPNGAGCDPVCYQTSLTYDEASNTLMQR